jgi:hypothetical protein
MSCHPRPITRRVLPALMLLTLPAGCGSAGAGRFLTEPTLRAGFGGSVNDPDGRPVSGAAVTVEVIKDLTSGPVTLARLTGGTNTDGGYSVVFSLTPLGSPAQLRVQVRAAPPPVSPLGAGLSDTTLSVSDGGQYRIDVRLGPGP